MLSIHFSPRYFHVFRCLRLGPAAFWRFFHTVHGRIAAPATAYSDELRVCIDAFVRIYGGKLPSGIVLLSSSSQSQSQSQPHVVARVTGETPAPTEVGKDIREQDKHVRSIEVIIRPTVCFLRSPLKSIMLLRTAARGYPGLAMRYIKRGDACVNPSKINPRICPRTLATCPFHFGQRSEKPFLRPK